MLPLRLIDSNSSEKLTLFNSKNETYRTGTVGVTGKVTSSTVGVTGIFFAAVINVAYTYFMDGFVHLKKKTGAEGGWGKQPPESQPWRRPFETFYADDAGVVSQSSEQPRKIM